MEARQVRRNEEIDRRNLQQRVNGVLTNAKEQRTIASNIAKQYLKYFKRDTLMVLRDMGLLRNKKEYSIGTHYIPHLYN